MSAQRIEKFLLEDEVEDAPSENSEGTGQFMIHPTENVKIRITLTF